VLMRTKECIESGARWVNMKTSENESRLEPGPTLTRSPTSRASMRTKRPLSCSTVAEAGKQDEPSLRFPSLVFPPIGLFAVSVPTLGPSAEEEPKRQDAVFSAPALPTTRITRASHAVDASSSALKVTKVAHGLNTQLDVSLPSLTKHVSGGSLAFRSRAAGSALAFLGCG
jgi:hypothetical protein